MNSSTIIAIIIIAIIAVLAVVGIVRRSKGKNSCCGSGGVIIEPTKKLENPVVSKKVASIEGMHCDNCRNHVTRSLQRIDGVSCLVDLKKNKATIELDREVPEEELVTAIESGGYKVLSMKSC